MELVKLIVKLIHVGSAMFAVGGVLFTWLVAMPLSRANEEQFAPLYRRFGALFAVALVLLLATGIYNISYIAPKMGTGYNMIFGGKFTLSVIFFALAFALYHPAAVFERIQAKRAGWLVALGVLAIVIIALSVQMNSMRVWTLPLNP